MAAVSMRRAGWLFDKEPVFVADAVLPRPGPEFAHGRVVPAQAALRVNGNGVRAAGFRMNQQAVLVGVVAEQTVMMVDGQVAQGLAVIGQETIALVPSVDNSSS